MATTVIERGYRDIAIEAQKHRDASIAEVDQTLLSRPEQRPLPRDVTGVPAQVLTQDELSITESAPEDLLHQLATARLSAIGVTKAFLRRAGLAQTVVSSSLPYASIRTAIVTLKPFHRCRQIV